MPWSCECGCDVSDTNEVCTYCGTPKGGRSAHAQISALLTSDSGAVEQRLALRYTDAYRVARFFISTGSALKWVGGIIGGLAVLVMLSTGSGPFIMIGIIGGVALFAILFVLGVLVSAQGQMLSATLDGTVNALPTLTNEQKLRIMFSE